MGILIPVCGLCVDAPHQQAFAEIKGAGICRDQGVWNIWDSAKNGLLIFFSPRNNGLLMLANYWRITHKAKVSFIKALRAISEFLDRAI